MLKHPVMVGLAPFEMANGQRKITFLNRFHFALAPHPHDSSRGRAHILPISSADRVLVHSAQKGFWRARQFG